MTTPTFRAVLVALFCMLSSLSAATFGNFTYTVTGGTSITIDRYYSAASGAVVVPSTINGISVTSIGWGAFYGCSGLTSVTIPVGVTTIEDQAFHGCSGLISVTIPSSVVSIGYIAFYGCSSLTSITIPSSVTSIGDYAFEGCSGLTSVTIPSSVTNIGERVFYGCSGLTSVTIPSSVVSIGYSAFYGCSSLTSVTIPSSIPNIGERVFYGCSGLTSITIPSSVTSIGNEAFNGCSRLVSITIPSSVTSIGDQVFSGCSGLTSFTVASSNVTYSSLGGVLFNKNQTTLIQCPGGVKGSITIPSSVISIGYYAFSGCSGLTSVTIPIGVTSIEGGAFSGCSGLTSVTIPSGVTSIGGGAFSGCSGLTSVTIPVGVTSIGYYAFSGCCGLTSVTIPATVTGIGDQAFSGCSSLTSVTIPSSVTNIGEWVFYGCSSLTSITIPSRVTGIGYAAFSGCSGLTSVTIPSSVTYIGSEAFSGCSGLTSITIPSIIYIQYRTFYGCSGLTSFTIPSSVTYIGDEAFYGCSGLASIAIPVGVTNIDNRAFSGCSGLKSIAIPVGVTNIGGSAFSGCSGLTTITVASSNVAYSSLGGVLFDKNQTKLIQCPGGVKGSITIPSSVTSIGVWAFLGCSGLTSVTIPIGVTSIEAYAFSGCSGLTSVTIPSSVTRIEYATFSGCSGLTSIMIPSGVTYIWTEAFYGCSGLTSITIPSSVTIIAGQAFYGCSGLTNAKFMGNAPSMFDAPFTGTASSFTVSYLDTKTGFTSPTWLGYTSKSISSVSRLSGLILSSGNLSPGFATGTNTYTASVPNLASSITVTPTVTDATATVKVNGVSVTSGFASGSISLAVDSNMITTVVTAEDGTTASTYTITVTRAPSAIATLSGLSLSSGALSPTFVSSTASYAAGVPIATTSIRITPTVTDATATIAVNGTTVASGASSGAISLAAGTNTITTVVTAQDGVTKSIYAITVTRGLVDAVFSSATTVPFGSAGYNATGNAVNLSLGFAPAVGTTLTLVDNLGLGFITGQFSNLAQGQVVNLTYNGLIYKFVANYYGGSGNDLVLNWAYQNVVDWGANDVGQLGNGSATSSSVPVVVTQTGVLAGKTVLSAVAAGSHSLALCSDGTVAAWGDNSFGQLGNNSLPPSNVPVAVSNSGVLAGKTVISVAAAGNHSMALCSDGTVVAWGDNSFGQLGNNSTVDSKVPVLVTQSGVLAGKTVVSVAAGLYHSLALCSDGTMVSWGWNSYGQLGNDSMNDSSVPVSVTQNGVLAGKEVVSISAGAGHSY